MHLLFEQADKFSKALIGAAIEVHRHLGPGLIESIYEKCLMRELALRGISAVQQKVIHIEYKQQFFDEPLRFDVLVEDCLLVEVKAVEAVLGIHKAQLFSYMKLLDVPVGLLINFNERVLKSGISRLILPTANQKEVDLLASVHGTVDPK